RPLGQIACGLDEGLAEIDSGHLATMARRQKARRSADSRADIDHRVVGGDPGQLGEFRGGREPPRMELVERSQLPEREGLLLRAADGKYHLQPFGEAARAIVLA